MPFKVHFYVALFLLNGYTILSTFGTQTRNNLISYKNSDSKNTSHSNNNNNNGHNNNSGTAVAHSNNYAMDTAAIMPNHSYNDFMYSHQTINEQQAASIKLTNEFEQNNSTENERGNFHFCTKHTYVYVIHTKPFIHFIHI